MPARSTRVTLRNRTPFTLTLTNSGLDHGQWTDGGWNPPASIAPEATLGWQSESEGIATGTEGSVTYYITSSWHTWILIHPEVKMQPGATVTALWHGPDHLDLFVTGTDGAVWSAYWETASGWHT